MSNKLCTFMNLFEAVIELEGEEKKSVRPQKIIIPKIQRDYAQGRETNSIRSVRKNFLEALYKAVTEKPIILDFVYGSLDADGILTPMDGQQRLTTLFLLHWYAARREKISSEKTFFLKKFSYETRPDSREFCKCLVSFTPNFSEKNLSAEIENQAWFPLSWKKDPTVSSMLKMLDDIDEKFRDVKNLWSKLEDGAISFYFLPIQNMGLTDEIYITMNSRGKPLTNFEHFKAEFKSLLDKIDANVSNRIIHKIDTTWTDLLWKYRDGKNLIDGGFLGYFRFLCDIILYRNGDTTKGKDRTDFGLLEIFFDGGNEQILANADFLEKSFDCWLKIENIDKFFSERISQGSYSNKNINRHETGKIVIYQNLRGTHFFANCLRENYLKDDGSKGTFSLIEKLFLYAFLIYLLNRDKISDKNFRRRIRMVNNLINNSEDISDSEDRQSGNRIPAMLKQIDSIVIDGKILSGIGPNFNEYQLNEEKLKLIWTEKNPDKAESLFALEDHYLLYGQIGIIELDYPQYFERFISLFNCNYDNIDCALLAKGDYLQAENNGWRYQLGCDKAESWQKLFHRSSQMKNFEYTQAALSALLDERKDFTDIFLQKVKHDFLDKCEREKKFEWSYYYLKYKEFRPHRHGKYCWNDFQNKPYEFLALWGRERVAAKSYQPFLKAIDKNNSMTDEDYPIFGKRYVECINNAYILRDIKTNDEMNRLKIKQKQGIDIEDRISTFRRWAEGYLY